MTGARLTVVLVALLVVASPCRSQEQPGAGAPRHERVQGKTREGSVQELRIRRARGVTRRIAHDRRASVETKQQASELEALLDRRQALLAGLDKRHEEFLAQHKAEIDELTELAQRSRELERRITDARTAAMEAAANDVKAIKETSGRALALAETLRATYLQQRRERRHAP